MGLFDKLFHGLDKTRANMEELEELFRNFSPRDDDFYDELEDILITSDLGVSTADYVVSEIRRSVKEQRIRNGQDARQCVIDTLNGVLCTENCALSLDTVPSVILVVGVNGVGKTTTIGKLSKLLISEGKSVILAAADTFRAAAGEQLSVWAERTGAQIVRHEEGSDPSAVVFDTISAAKARNSDVIIIDTAGRLHNKSNLMNELNKISRIIGRELPDSSVETLMVLDATTGQNGLIQARQFAETSGLTGVILTKLDGTAKGGIVYSIARELGLPVKYIGVGEGVDDLLPFDPVNFTTALFN